MTVPAGPSNNPNSNGRSTHTSIVGSAPFRSLLEQQWALWTESSDFLGVGPPYLTECPPMWFIGGGRIPEGGCPLAVLGLEPLEADHFRRQVAFATRDFDSYSRWQLDYFNVFPTAGIGGPQPQPYWRTMFHLLAGFADSSSSFEWGTFRDSYIELPLVPLHARRHQPRAFKNAARALSVLLQERMRLVVESWPNVVFFGAGASVADALPAVAGVPDVPVEMPPDAQVHRGRLGAALFDRRIVRRSVHIGGGKSADVILRRAPFSNGHQPTAEGIRLLGEVLRGFKPSDATR